MKRIKLHLVCLFSIPYTLYLHIKHLLIILNYICKSWFHDVNCAIVGDRIAEHELGNIPTMIFTTLTEEYPLWFRLYTAGVNNLLSYLMLKYIDSINNPKKVVKKKKK